MPFRQKSIDELCELTGLSQRKLALRMDLDQSLITYLKQGKRKPSVDTIDKLYRLASEYHTNIRFYERP